MATATSSRLYVRGAAVAAAGVALTTDFGLDERPTHSVVLGLVAVVVWAIHRRLSRRALALTTLPAVSAALAVQPVLHLVSKVDHSPAGAHGQEPGVLSDFAIDAPVAGMQLVVPVAALIASAVVAHLLYCYWRQCAAHWAQRGRGSRRRTASVDWRRPAAWARCCVGVAG
jgi:hypothetical protein